jgi:hypothetical protein
VIVARMTATIATGIISHKTRRFAALTFPSSTGLSLTQERDGLLDLPDVVADASGHGGAFAAVGKCLFWLVALGELAEHVDPDWRGDRSEVKEQLRGLRCARNRVAHGHSVIAPTGWQPGAEPGRLVLGRSRLGAVSIFHWESPEALGQEAAGQKLFSKYRDHVAGQPVTPVLEAAFNACRR